MTATLKGADALKNFLSTLPAKMEQGILRSALKAGADVIAEGAREECRSEEVREAIKTTSRSENGVVSAKVQVKGPGAYIAPWLEFGTAPHFISVDQEASGGRTARRVNRLGEGSEVHRALLINGHFVGETVHHPGAKPYPFMRPAADNRAEAAIEAIGETIAKRATKEGFEAPAPAEEPNE